MPTAWSSSGHPPKPPLRDRPDFDDWVREIESTLEQRRALESAPLETPGWRGGWFRTFARSLRAVRRQPFADG